MGASAASGHSVPEDSVREAPDHQRLPPLLSDILVFPQEQVMKVDSLKSGVVYSAVVRFPEPVYLTDLSIPSTEHMSSVSVDVWLTKPSGAESSSSAGTRVAHSTEINDKSLMLGNLIPPPLCQFAKVHVRTNVHVCVRICMSACNRLPWQLGFTATISRCYGPN